MEKSQYDLCVEILRRFNRAGLLSEFILVGSWAMVFYKKQFSQWPRLRKFVLLTRDVDFLITSARRINSKVDIPKLLEDLSFVVTFYGSKGYMKLNHPELIIEFLTPERGKGEEKPRTLSGMGINAMSLRFLDYLAEDTIKVSVENFTLTLPQPARFALHKVLVARRRRNIDKRDKDNMAAVEILHDLMEAGKQADVRRAYQGLHPQWRKRVIAGLRSLALEEIVSILK